MLNLIERIAKPSVQIRRLSIIKELENNNIDYELQEVISFRGNATNILVSLNPSNHRIVVLSHYDAVPGVSGANDNAAACAINLSLIKEFKDSNLSIDFLFTDREETGFIGSSGYIDQIGINNIKYAINLDMCGIGSEIGISNNEKLYDIIPKDIIDKYKANIIYYMPIADHVSFNRSNIPVTTVIASTKHDIPIFNNEYYEFPDYAKTMHTKYDTINTIEEFAVNNIFNFVKDIIKYQENCI